MSVQTVTSLHDGATAITSALQTGHLPLMKWIKHRRSLTNANRGLLLLILFFSHVIQT